MAGFSLGKLELGVAAAATQIEGGDENNSWYDWCEAGHIKDGSSTLRADDHWNRWREDTELLAAMGVKHYRLGVEWSRIEPEEGVFSEAALERYREELALLKEKGVRPLVTLHHFTNPRWFEEKGAFLAPDAVDFYLRFVKKTVAAFGPQCAEYITINEPNVYATNGYFFGEWPPAHKSLGETIKVIQTMAKCHVEGYRLIHSVRRDMGLTDTAVGFAHHMRLFQPLRPKNLMDKFFTAFNRRFFQSAITRTFTTGAGCFPLKRVAPAGIYCDFHGLNYYSTSASSGLRNGVRPGVPLNDLGWEIYAPGIVKCAQDMQKCADRPIYITENGTCDNTDMFRTRYLYEHIKALVDSGLPVERYYHWCFLDNFEWLEGESARFGLIHVDYETQKRTIKRSGEFYAAMIREGGVSEALHKEYCEVEYHD